MQFSTDKSVALVQFILAQLADDFADPLISQGSDVAIFVGLVALAIATVFAIKAFDTKLERTLVSAFGFSVALLTLLWYL